MNEKYLKHTVEKAKRTEEIKIMTEKYTVEEMAPTRWYYYFEDKNGKGERLTIEVIKCEVENPNDKNCLLYLWKKNGFIDRILTSYWSIQTFVHDTEGNCFGLYNPTVKRSEDGKRSVINFDWMLEATEENLNLLLEEVYNRFMSATGKTATELKLDKIEKYGEEHNLKVYEELPKGWKRINIACVPLGSVLISNGKSFRSNERKEGLLLI